jgi:dual specificity tyrosine-phosphorylation-regulated kinase 2/3/4
MKYYIMKRYYRAPEVILGLPYEMAIDMWSFGCIMAELVLGYPIFPGENEPEQMAYIMEVLGEPERSYIENAPQKKYFFNSVGKALPFVNSRGKTRLPNTKDLKSVIKCQDHLFVDFLS